MSDDNRANDNDTGGPADEDRLPWLEAVEEDGEREGPSVGKLVGAILIGLLAIGLIVGGLYWLGNRNAAGEGNDIITAERGDYKQHPENPGGMNLSGEGNTSVAASEGAQPRGNLNLNGVAEQPAAPGHPAPAPTAPAPAPQHPAPVPAPAPAPQHPAQAPAPAPAASGPAIQLGAFSSPAAANSAWTALAGRFRYLAPLAHNVVPVQAGGRTLHRLRASGPGSADICRRLQAAGEACAVVN
jgi:hypothetical protein